MSQQPTPPNAPTTGAASPVTEAWGMVVDLDRCTGCQACVVACQAENNIPINTEQDFLDHRAKAWIRIERYWEGEFPDVKARFLPVLCQHCQNAPCEPVCPVYATMHSSDGLNTQIYNRCVGTRYCANNCPYSVRYFNWDAPGWPVPLEAQLNPDVTVRSSGVMEKCTFCVQRINRGRRTANQAGRPIQDGEVQPACAQACPTNTLIFGNWADPNSRIRQLAEGSRSYRLLEQYGTEPAVVYLKKVDPNLSPEPVAGEPNAAPSHSSMSRPAASLSPAGERRRSAIARLMRREVEGRWLGTRG
ncbi:MAG: 4Fe-4S dicluster domain-containing protein [Chloroflexota bacterium]